MYFFVEYGNVTELSNDNGRESMMLHQIWITRADWLVEPRSRGPFGITGYDWLESLDVRISLGHSGDNSAFHVVQKRINNISR